MLSMGEDNLPQSPETVVLDDNFRELGNQVSDSLDSLSISMDDLESIDEAITEAVDTASELMDEADVVRQAQQQGDGMSQAALESIQRNVNYLVKLVGMAPTASFALESYSNPRYNDVAMESAVDNIKAFIKRIWDAIKSAFDKTVEIIQNLYKKFFDVSVKLKARAEALGKKAKAQTGKTAPADMLVGGLSLSKYMRFKNKALTPEELLKNFDKWTAYSHNFISGIAGDKAIVEYKKHVEDVTKLLKETTKERDAKKLKAHADMLANRFLKRTTDSFQFKKNGLHNTDVLLGDIVYVFDEKEVSFFVDAVDNHKELPTEQTHEVLTTAQVETMCAKISAHMDSYKNMEKHFKNLADFKKSISEIAAQTIKSDDPTDYLINKMITQVASFTIKAFIKAIQNVGVGARRHDMNVDTAVVDWCEKSLVVL